jgi:DNA-binding protein YbaB
MTELDPERIERVSRATIAALENVAARASRLAALEVEGMSPDRRIQVRVTAGGAITELRLRDNVLRRYDTSALSELVTRTIVDAQRRARDAYERELAALTPPEVAESEAELQRIWRD